MHHPVLQAIAQRQRHGSIPGRRQDDFKIAIAIEGGAMRGVVSSGMVAGLEYLGLLPAFDVIYGTSAGAINGAYFVAGQAAYGSSIYYEDINDPQFMSPLRCLCGDPPLSLEFLFEHVMINEKPLNWRRVLDSQIELVPVAASLSQARAVPLRGARSRYDLFLRLKASARIPFVAGPPVCVDGEDCADGGLFASVPFRQALDEGCTHVLALLTRPASTPLSRTSLLSRYVFSRMLASYNPLLRNVLVNRVNRYGRELDWLNTQTCAPSGFPYVYAVSLPRGTPIIRRFEKRPERLVFGARCGMTSILQSFGHQDTSCTRILSPHRQSPKAHTRLAWNEDIAMDKQSSFPSLAIDAFNDVPVEPPQWSASTASHPQQKRCSSRIIAAADFHVEGK
jgi:predicted patatin/cPLA2 family phospholipase